MAIQLSTASRNALLDSITTSVGSAGILRLYTGTAPVNVGAALAGNTLLASLTCGSPFAPAASGGTLTANAISNDTSADATGTATFFRLFQSDGTTAVLQGTVGTSGADLILSNTVSIVAGATISVSSFVLTAPGA